MLVIWELPGGKKSLPKAMPNTVLTTDGNKLVE